MNIDLDGAFKGEVPWSAEGWQEANEWYHALLHTPQDDWNLAETGLTDAQFEMIPPEAVHRLEELTEIGLVGAQRANSPLAVRINAFHPWNQLACFLMDRYPTGEWIFHLWRFLAIGEFLLRHRRDLKRDGLMRHSTEEHDEIREQAIEALCLLPFTRTCYVKGEEQYTFDYKEVVAKAREFIDRAGNPERDEPA